MKSCLDGTKYHISIDLSTTNGKLSTIPPHVLVIKLIPDIVIIDKNSKTIEIFEFTYPSEGRIKEAHKLKIEKYDHHEL